MTDDKLAEIAYDSYCDARKRRGVRVDSLPSWQKQSEDFREAWVSAAMAVVSAYKSDQIVDGPDETED